MPGTTSLVSVVIVNYNSGGQLSRCIETLFNTHDHQPEVIVVDNASHDESWQCADSDNRVQLVRNIRNTGFAAACNQAAREASGEFLFFVNPDLWFSEPVIPALLSYLAEHPDVAAIGPKLLHPDGTLQPSRGRFPSVFSSLVAVAHLRSFIRRDETIIGEPNKPGSSGVLSRLLSPWFAQFKPVTGPETVDYVTGACLLVRRNAFDAIDGFDERFFLYYDEIDLCKRLSGHTVFLPTVEVRHTVAGCSGGDPWLPLLYRRQSMLRYFGKHGSSGAFFAILLILRLEQLARYLFAGLWWLVNFRDYHHENYARHLRRLLTEEGTRETGARNENG